MDPIEAAIRQLVRSSPAPVADRYRLILADWLDEHDRESEGFVIRYHLAWRDVPAPPFPRKRRRSRPLAPPD